MAFYKLFYIVHRRTDYFRLVTYIDKIIRPEYYIERKKTIRNAIMQLAIATNLVQNINGHN